MRNASTGSGTQRGRRRLFMWLGVLSLLMSMMGPMFTLWAADAAAARGEEQEQQCDPGFYYDDNAGACVEEPECPEGQAWDPSQGYCVDDPNYQPDDTDTPVGIQIEKWYCESADPGWGFNELSQNCSQNNNPVTFTHGGDGISEESASVTNYAEWTDQPAGNHYVYEDVPDGYGTPRVWCSYYDPYQGNASPDSESSLQNGNAVGWNLDPGQYVYCWWFNILESYGQIHITKYDCAEFTEDPTRATWQYLQSECDTWSGDPVEYQLWLNGSQADSASTGSGGEASFDQAPAGDITIAEVLPEGYTYSIVYCTYYPSDQQNEQDYQPVSVQDGSYHEWTLEPNYVLDCYWFNFYESTGSWIDFYKYVCPYDLDSSNGADYLLSECEAREDWDFDVSWDGGGSTETTDSSGKASWSGVPQGEWSGSEEVPDGWGQPVLWCRYVEWPDDASYNQDWFEYDLSGGSSIDYTFDYDGVRIECYWFNFESSDDYNWVDFYKYTCPYDLYESGGSWDYFSQECSPTSDWDFDVSWDGGGSTQTTDGDGLASWSEVPQGSWGGSESYPGDWADPVVYCRYVEWPDDAGYSDEWTQYDVADGSISGEFEYTGVRIECYWFNFAPDTYNWVDFYKYTCPYDLYDSGGSWDYYSSECSPTEDWSFDLIWENGGNDQTTGSDGKASWSGVPGGTWTGSEDFQDGWNEPYIYCRYVEWPDDADYNQDWFEVTSSSGSFDFDFEYDSGVRIECYWFNFPPDDYNWVDFYKYTCPYDLYESGGSYEYFIDECEALPDWPFDLTWDGGGSTQMTTDSGPASWSGVPQGIWTGHEDVPDGWEVPYVYCRYVEWPDDADYSDEWTQYDVSDGAISGEFEYEAGVRIECYWFNFEPDEYNWVDFYKYTCPYDIYDTSGTWDYYSQECEPTEAWELTVGWDQGANESKTTGSDGSASWSGVPTGSWWGQEDVPGGYEQPIVWCRYTEWPDDASYSGDWESYTVTDGRIDGSFDYDNTRIECYWFNFAPEGGSWVQFYKLWCSDEATYDASFDDLVNSYCEYRDDLSADISLTYGGSTSTKTATGQSPAEWQAVPTGEWTVEEDEYDGWGQPIIWCQYVEWPDGTDGYSQDPWQLETSGWQGSWNIEDDGVRIACVIFNIPYQQNWVDITKWWCSEDVTTPYERDYSDLTDECETYTDGVDFTLEWNGGSETATTDGDGNAEWGGLPGGDWSLHEDVPDGYSDPVVWCSWVEWPSGVSVSDEPYSFTAPHGSFTGSFDWSGMRLHCDIFNIPTYDPGWITVYKWYCAEGVPTDSAPEYLRDQCDIVTTGVDFNLEYGDASVPATTDSTGMAVWDNVPVGTWTLTETVSDGYGTPVIYCQWVEWSSDYDNEYSQDLYQPTQEGASITGTHQYPGLRLVCYWFNFEYTTGDHWVTFYKYYCPPASDYGDDISQWVDNCQTQDGVQFTMTGDSTNVPKTTAGGTAEWTGVDDGDYTFSESLPDGYGEPVVWCTRWEYTPGESSDQSLDLSSFESASAPEGSWDTSFEGGPWRVVCYWFNIPNDESTITIYKYNCEYKPAGYSSLWQWQEACTKYGNGITFTLDNSNGSSEKVTADGKVAWSDVPTGEFTVTEDPVAGYGTPVIWCGWTAYYNGAVYDAFPQQIQGAPGIVEGEISYPGTTWFCWWFNIPEDHSKVVVYKFNCPEGAHISGDLEDYQYDCKEYGDGVDFTLENSQGSSTRTVSNGSASWYDVPQGDFTLSESVPEGYGDALWWCGYVGYEGGAVYDGFPQKVDAPGGVYEGSIDFDVTYYFCYVFNFPDYDREITVYKWWCPPDWSPDSDSYQDWKKACSAPLSGVSFNLSWDGGSSWKNTNLSGRASWYGYDPDEYTLTEQYLPGYEAPYVFCSLDASYEDGAAYAENYTWYDVSNRSVSKDLGDYQEYKWTCHFFNIEKGPGDITVYKWNCPPGYDPHAWNADPTRDCSQARNDVDFVLDRPTGPNVIRTTGDDGNGAVFFGDLDPGYYVVTEKVPSDTEYVFIWDCYGGDIPAVHPTPLQWGKTLNLKVAGGDHIVCHWYNVPYPEDGWVTLYKYQCWTKTYTSDVDCEIYEFGASFELSAAEGGASQGTGTTNSGGTYTWSGLDEGAYDLEEISHQPCKITSTKVSEDGDVWVDAGKETIVKVYNCAPPGEKPTPGGKVPTKYPNTGVGDTSVMPVSLAQDDGDDEDASDDEDSQVIEPDDAEASPDDEITPAEFYNIACIQADDDEGGDGNGNGNGDGQGSGNGDGSGNQNEDDNGSDLPPFLQGTSSDEADQPADDEEASDDGSDEDQAATTDDECVRGALPDQVVIDAADVNHPVEFLEIVDGVMQPPSGPQYVSWYKETARLGEQNNIVIAGHVNWWGVPQGPFYGLIGLQEGDTIQITGDDGKIYVFEVQWVRQESNLDAPNPEVVGPTGEATLTLITCGGEWDPSISEYNERTVVRAIQVDVIDPATTDTGDDDQEEDDGQSFPAPVAFIRSIWTERLAA